MEASPDLGSTELGPISPELVLVDPALAEHARKLLPNVNERPERPTPVASSGDNATTGRASVPPVAMEPAAPAPTHRWRRMLVLAVLVFVAGAVSGTFLGNRDSAPVGVTLGIQTEVPSARSPTVRVRTTRRSTTSAQTTTPAKISTRATLRPPTLGSQVQNGSTANVLGVEARVDDAGVTLSWHRPARSGHVVILRGRGRARGGIAYEGRDGSYSDSNVRPCTGYRYTIVNYDRRGHPSTGVPTYVVTSGCS